MPRGAATPSILSALLACGASALTFFAASDTHLGHDSGVGANKTTSYTKNVWAIKVRDTGGTMPLGLSWAIRS